MIVSAIADEKTNQIAAQPAASLLTHNWAKRYIPMVIINHGTGLHNGKGKAQIPREQGESRHGLLRKRGVAG